MQDYKVDRWYRLTALYFSSCWFGMNFFTVIVRISSCEKKGNFIFHIEVDFSKLSYWEQTHQAVKADARHGCNIQLPQQWLTISLFMSSSMKHSLTYEMQMKVYKLSRQYIKIHPELAVIQFQLFYEAVKLSLSVLTLEEGLYPKPPLLFLWKHDEDKITRGWVSF